MGASYVIVTLDKTDLRLFNSEVCVILRVNSAAQAYPRAGYVLSAWIVISIPHKGALCVLDALQVPVSSVKSIYSKSIRSGFIKETDTQLRLSFVNSVL